MECKFCKKVIKNAGSLTAHEKYHCLLNKNRLIISPWNKGKTTNLNIKQKISSSLKGRPGRPHTEKTKKLLSDHARRVGYGGYIPGSGRGKKGWYDGIFCDSSWELAYVIYCKDKKIPIARNNTRLTYTHNGVFKTYIPDFLVNDELVEIKGYKSEQWHSKIEQHPYIKVIDKDAIIPILEYVVEKYGKNFIDLYDR